MMLFVRKEIAGVLSVSPPESKITPTIDPVIAWVVETGSPV
jgi:hypothetical protein